MRAGYLKAGRPVLGADVPVGRVDRISRSDDDRVTPLPAADVRSSGLHRTGDVRTQHVREADIGKHRAHAHVEVIPVDAAGLDSDQQLTRTGFRLSHILVLEHVRSAELSYHGSLHRGMVLYADCVSSAQGHVGAAHAVG